MRIEIKSVKRGDHFWERNMEFMATEDATSEMIEFNGGMVGQHTVYGTPVEKTLPKHPEIIKFMETEGAEHYGPKLQDRNMYGKIDLGAVRTISKEDYEAMIGKMDGILKQLED